MPSLRFIGEITAKTPIFISRPGQGDNPLTMVVIRGDRPQRVAVIPGETIKGAWRSCTFKTAVAAAQAKRPDLTMSLDKLYEQSKGGIAFSARRGELEVDEELRAGNQILSLFGSATPRLNGRLIIEPAIARPTISPNESLNVALPDGARRDPVLTDAELAKLLTPEDQKIWAKQASIVSAVSAANRDLKDALRALFRARDTVGVDARPFEATVKKAETAIALLESDENFTFAVQRPVPSKVAVPSGTVFDHEFEIRNGTHGEIGLFLAGLDRWALDPRIGGGRSVGHGRIEASYAISELVIQNDDPFSNHWVRAGELRLDRDQITMDGNETLRTAQGVWREDRERILESKIFK